MCSSLCFCRMPNCALAASTELPPGSVQPASRCLSPSPLDLYAFGLHSDVCGERVPDTTPTLAYREIENEDQLILAVHLFNRPQLSRVTRLCASTFEGDSHAVRIYCGSVSSAPRVNSSVGRMFVNRRSRLYLTGTEPFHTSDRRDLA